VTVENIGLATGMLTEDVITAVKFMGVLQPDTSPKKRKLPRLTGDDEPDKGPTMIIRMSDVKEWANTNHLSLEDPVKEEGFLGEWLPLAISGQIESSTEADG
jgi:hypothetical protein